MRIWKSSILFLGVAMLMLSAVSVSAISDGTGDIWHWASTESGFVWQQYSGTNDKIDITNLDYSIEGSEATMTMTVAAPIEDADTLYYLMHLLMGDDYYMATYLNGNGLIIGSGGLSGFYQQITAPVSGNTFTATFTVDDPDANYEIRGYAAEFSTYGDETGAEWWGDWAPDTYFNEYTGIQDPDGTNGDGDGDGDGDGTGDGDTTDGDGDGTTGGTPGFEAIAVLTALVVVLILFKRKK